MVLKVLNLKLKLRTAVIPYAGVTFEPTLSPNTARRMFPGLFMLKMTMGMPLSMHKEIAVASITFKFW